MSDENLIEWKSDIDEINQEKIEKFSKKKRRRESYSDKDELNKKNNEESHQIIVSDAINLTEEEKRKCT